MAGSKRSQSSSRPHSNTFPCLTIEKIRKEAGKQASSDAEEGKEAGQGEEEEAEEEQEGGADLNDSQTKGLLQSHVCEDTMSGE